MSKRQEIREKQRRQERMQRILLIGGISVIALVVVAFMVASSLPRTYSILDAPVVEYPQANFNAMGDPNAPVKIIEYADFQCPFCRNFYEDTEAQLIDTYIKTGKVYFEYHSFGNFIGAESARAAEAAYCAGDQGKFWEMHDLLFTNQGAENSGALKDDKLKALAAHLELDITKFNSCFDGGQQKGRVTQDGLDARAANVSSTPTFFVNGTEIKGAQPFSTFQQTIDAALTAAGQ